MGSRLLAMTMAFALSGCATIYNPATQRQETVLDTGVELALGNVARSQMGLTSLSMGRVAPEQSERVKRIGETIAKVSDRQDVPYQFGVIQEKSLNAFALPGGTIYVHTGLLEKATDEELAGVLAHEVGHVAARHVSKHLKADLGFAVLMQVAGRAGAAPGAAEIANSLYGLFSRGFSRRDELESDRLAVRYLRRAGYDPRALVSFFEKMQQERPEGPLEKAMNWQSTHPLTSDRIARANEEIARAKSEKTCPACGRSFPAATRFCTFDGTRLPEKSG